jgi:hypothetical protein
VGADGTWTISGESIEIREGYVDLPWLSATKFNDVAVRLALELHKYFPDCVFINVGAGGVVTPEELLESLERFDSFRRGEIRGT